MTAYNLRVAITSIIIGSAMLLALLKPSYEHAAVSAILIAVMTLLSAVVFNWDTKLSSVLSKRCLIKSKQRGQFLWELSAITFMCAWLGTLYAATNQQTINPAVLTFSGALTVIGVLLYFTKRGQMMFQKLAEY